MKHLSAVLPLLLASGALAQGGERLSRECRREIISLCGFNRAKIRECLAEKGSQVSKPCFEEVRARVQQRFGQADRQSRQDGARTMAALGATEYAYGADAQQKLDFYKAKQLRAPLVIFVHGGGWSQGDKGNATGEPKVRNMAEQGYAFASLNYRLVPGARVEDQAADIARALAYLRSNAAKLGFDPARIVLMGHSAGAHLVALVGTDEKYLRDAGLSFASLQGVVPIDGAAYDVATQMVDGNKLMQKSYRDAFGTDPARQAALSPTLQAAAPNAPSFLLLHVQRPDGVRQSKALAEALSKAGSKVQINAFEGEGLKGHLEINRKLGASDYPATAVLNAWLATTLRAK